MIKAPMLQVFIKHDMSTTTVSQVPPHELALLSCKWGEGPVTVNKVGSKVVEYDPREEYARLARVHGIDKETKRPWVEVAFGRFEEGRLENTMIKGAEHYKSELTPQQKAAKTRAKNKANKVKKPDVEDAVAATG